MKLNFNFSGKTLLKDWWKTVRDNFTTIQTDHNTLSDKLDTEITQRTNADVGLSDQITAEKKARESADSSLSSRINNEVTIRQAADNELQRNIDSEITERQTADSKKADKTELYGTDETTKHTITHTLTTSDFVITTDSYDRGTVKIPAETVHSKILLDGSPMPATEVIGTFDCGKSEEDHGDKYVAIAYSPNTGKLDIDVVDIDCSPTDADAIAEINIQYQTAEITKMYHLSHIFYGISNLNDLKTNNKNSFLAAVNEISTKLTTEISDREDAEHSLTEKISTEISDRQAADDELKAKFTDLKTVAFTGSYTDLSNKPTSMQNPNSLTLTMNGSATSYNGSATASKSWYAPTSAGTTGYNLISNGSGAPIWQQPPYAVCPDSPSISDRRLSITNFKLLTGVRVLVRFTYPFAGTQGKVTLNVNSTGAKEVKLLRADGSYDAITQYNSWSTNEIVEFVYDGTYWVALSSDKQFVSGKPSVITVGSSTVTRYCDFKCSGTDDDIVIQKAMDSLTDGGKIILLEGTYNLSSRLLQKKNVVIEGQGRGITKVNTSYIFLISNLVGTSPTLHLTNMDINFLSTSNISPNAGAFNDYDVLQIDNCSISYANTMHNTDSIFFNCKVKLKNSRISVTLPAKRYDNSHPCWWIFRDCTAEIIDTDIIFPTTSNNTLSNGVFYRCEGSMVGGFIKHIGTTVSSNHSYIEDDSTMNIIGTQIECRRFSQSETTTGNFNSLANCRIKILQAEGYFSASHINHCDLYISASVIFCAYCMASNCKLWFSAASLATLKNYCFFEACYTNQSTWIGTNGTGTSTTDTKTVSGMAAPSFRSVS
jgi:hypothetical protein